MANLEFDDEVSRLVEEFNASAGATARRARIVDALALKPGDRLLDVGSGPGHLDGAEVGFITSAVYSPRLEKNIGYAMLPAEMAELGNRLTVTVSDGDVREATVVPKPFIDPEKEIPKS